MYARRDSEESTVRRVYVQAKLAHILGHSAFFFSQQSHGFVGTHILLRLPIQSRAHKTKTTTQW